MVDGGFEECEEDVNMTLDAQKDIIIESDDDIVV